MEQQGLRVLACACSITNNNNNNDNISNQDSTTQAETKNTAKSIRGVYENLTFIGMVGISDPPRKGSKTTIETLKKYGIKTIMMTGDAKGTALAIAREVGILNDTFATSQDTTAPTASPTDQCVSSIFAGPSMFGLNNADVQSMIECNVSSLKCTTYVHAALRVAKTPKNRGPQKNPPHTDGSLLQNTAP